MDSYIVIWIVLLIFHVQFGRSSRQIQALFKRREGEYLENSVIRTEQTSSELECGSLCAKESSCMSVNYKKSGERRGLCELNNSTLDNSKRENRKKIPEFVNLWILKSNKGAEIAAYGSHLNPGKDCVDIKKRNPTATEDGEYWILTTTKTQSVYCFMDKGKSLINLALKKPTKQSSLYDAPRSSSKAVDGNKNSIFYDGSCSCTLSEYEPWWRVNLEKVYMVSKLVITNRGDCCPERLSNFEIRIGTSLNDNGNANPACGGRYSHVTGKITREIVCNPALPGQYVNIVLRGKTEHLTLCEVQIFPQAP